MWGDRQDILPQMDLQGSCQEKNLRTVLAACDVLSGAGVLPVRGTGGLRVPETGGDAGSAGPGSAAGVCRRGPDMPARDLEWALEHTAAIMHFHGRWEKLSDAPYVICDIGHNSHGLKYNFAQLEAMMESGRFGSLTIIYGAMADKDVDEIMRLLPSCAEMVFVTAPGRRAMPAGQIMRKYLDAGGRPEKAVCAEDIRDALEKAGVLSWTESGGGPSSGASGNALRGTLADAGEAKPAAGGREEGPDSGRARHLVYIGGSTYVVAGAVPYFRH